MNFLIAEGVVAQIAGGAASLFFVLVLIDFFVSVVRKGFPSAVKSVVLILSCLSALLLLLSELVPSGCLSGEITFEMAIPVSLLLIYRLGDGSKRMNALVYGLTSVMTAVSVLFLVMRLLHRSFLSVPEFIPVMVIVCLICCLSNRLTLEGGLFSEFLSFFALLILSMCTFIVSGLTQSIFAGLCFLSMIGLYTYLYFNIKRERNFLRENLPELATMGVTTPEDSRAQEAKPKFVDSYEQTYERLTILFEEQKPYLNEELTLQDIATALYTNRAYVSKSINHYAGRNFCQHVNYYRVQYSIQQFKKNPRLKVSELAEMSGFHTVASYNMAFRLFMDESPSEWCRRNRRAFGCGDESEKDDLKS